MEWIALGFVAFVAFCVFDAIMWPLPPKKK